MTIPSDRRSGSQSRDAIDERTLWAPVLASGERLLWSGRPARGLRWRSEDWALLPFGLVFFLFSLGWVGAAVWGQAPFFFVLWGFPFVAAGFYMAIGRFFWDARKRRKTRYALTDHRALILTEAGKANFASIPIAEGTEIQIRPGPLTSIAFRTPAEITVLGGPKAFSMKPGGYGFEFIEDGERVYRLILDLQERRRREAGRAPS